MDVGPSLDLVSQDSVRAFAAEVRWRYGPSHALPPFIPPPFHLPSSPLALQINKKYPKLHILVNNAGVSFMKKEFTSDNVGVIAQVGCAARPHRRGTTSPPVIGKCLAINLGAVWTPLGRWHILTLNP